MILMFGCTPGPEVRTISPIFSVSCACSAPPLCVSDQPAKRRGCRIEAHSAVAAAENSSNSPQLPRSLSRRLLLPPPIVGYHRRKLFDTSSPKIDRYFSLRRCSKSPSSLKIVRYFFPLRRRVFSRRRRRKSLETSCSLSHLSCR